jgi:hypothetical protein
VVCGAGRRRGQPGTMVHDPRTRARALRSYERPVPPAVDQSLFDRIIAEAVWQQAYVYGFGNYSRYGAGFLLGA